MREDGFSHPFVHPVINSNFFEATHHHVGTLPAPSIVDDTRPVHVDDGYWSNLFLVVPPFPQPGKCKPQLQRGAGRRLHVWKEGKGRKANERRVGRLED
jgi:hypothetical protein